MKWVSSFVHSCVRSNLMPRFEIIKFQSVHRKRKVSAFVLSILPKLPKWHFLEHKSSRKVDDWFWVHTRPSNEFKVKRGSRLGILDGNNEFILKKTRRRIWSIFLRIYLSTNDISRLTFLKWNRTWIFSPPLDIE